MKLKIPRNSNKRRRIGMSERPPALVIRLLEDADRHTYRLPEKIALSLIAQRKATAVGTLGAAPDFTLTLEDWEAATA